MAWLIQHRCSILDPDPHEYAMLAKTSSDNPPEFQKLTMVRCSDCGEQFMIVGHDFFNESHGQTDYQLPPGFVIARTARPS